MKVFLDNTGRFEDKDIFRDAFLDTLHSILENIQSHYEINTEKIYPLDLIIEDIEEDVCVDKGLKLKDDKLILSEWIFTEQHNSKRTFLYFAVIKSCFLILFKREFTDFDHTIINFLSILFIKELENISSFINIYSTNIYSKIFPSEIANNNYRLWMSLLNLLLMTKISSKILFEYYLNDDNPSSIERFCLFSDWVSDLSETIENQIAPFYVDWKLRNVLDLLVKNGYNSSTTKNISKELGVHLNSTRKYFRGLTTTFNTFWRIVVNIQKLNLHNYYIKVSSKEKKNIDTITNKLIENPYLKSLYFGKNEETNFLYSATLFSPHISSDNLVSLLSKYKNKNYIVDYSVQLIRKKILYGTVTSFPYKSTMKNLSSFIYNKNDNLKKYVLSVEQRDFSPEFEYKTESLDYNLLNFLSIMKGRQLLRGEFCVDMKELPKLYEKNGLSKASSGSKFKFLLNLETKVRQKDFLSYKLFMLKVARVGTDILIIDIPMPRQTQEKEVDEIIEKLRVFSCLGQIDVYDSKVLVLPRANHQHLVRKVIEKLFNDSDIYPTFYTINPIKSSSIPFHKLYDYDNET